MTLGERVWLAFFRAYDRAIADKALDPKGKAADAAIREFFKFTEEFLQKRTNGGWGLDAQSFVAALKREAGLETGGGE